jgi:hypothetical protein
VAAHLATVVRPIDEDHRPADGRATATGLSIAASCYYGWLKQSRAAVRARAGRPRFLATGRRAAGTTDNDRPTEQNARECDPTAESEIPNQQVRRLQAIDKRQVRKPMLYPLS